MNSEVKEVLAEAEEFIEEYGAERIIILAYNGKNLFKKATGMGVTEVVGLLNVVQYLTIKDAYQESLQEEPQKEETQKEERGK